MEKEEVIIETLGSRVRVVSMYGDETAPWHAHSDITENIFCLEGQVAVQLKSPKEDIFLYPGKRCQVEAERVHRVINPVNTASKYLMVQGTGLYDFKEVKF